MTDPARLSAREGVAAVRAGRLAPRDWAEGCLARIAARDGEVRAWAALDPEAVRGAADAAPTEGLLAGLPFGVKDVFATADLPTGCGSPIYQGRSAVQDAACVSAARQAGGIMLGKTHTTEFAAFHPTVTANPANFGHTPGGSSSGSAAAVADFMAPVAFGTQTAGSVIRPASFCGVVGYKPSFGTIDRTGLKPFADSLDTVGVFARDVADAALFAGAVAGWPALAAAAPAPPRRVLVCRAPHWERASPEMTRAVEDAAEACRNAGVAVADFAPPEGFDDVVALQEKVQLFEGWRGLAYEREKHAEALSEILRVNLERGRRIAFEDYLAALDAQARWLARFESLLHPGDILLTASAPGEAPEGLERTGDPIFNRGWTFLRLPCLSLPFGRGPKGLPLGIQLIGRFRRDPELLAAALHLERLLG